MKKVIVALLAAAFWASISTGQPAFNIEPVGRLYAQLETANAIVVDWNSQIYIAGGISGLQMVDANPISGHPPLLTGYWDSDASRTYGLAIQDTLAYLADWDDGLIILNIADRTHPQEIGSYPTRKYARKVAVLRNLVFLTESDSGLTILNAADPANITEVSRIVLPGRVYNVTLENDTLAYISAGAAGIFIYNISDPAHPVVIGFYNTAGEAMDICIDGHDRAYVADYTHGFTILDVSDPAQPRRLSSLDTRGLAVDAEVHDVLYIADSHSLDGDVMIYNVQDPEHPALISAITVPDQALEVKCMWDTWVGDLAFVAAASGGVRIFDVNNPAEPVEIARYEDPPCIQSASLAGSLSYVPAWTVGLKVDDLRIPQLPREVLNYGDTLGAFADVVVNGNYLFAIRGWLPDRGNQGVVSMDISNPLRPRLLDQWINGEFEEPGIFLSYYDHHLYCSGDGVNELIALYVSDPQNISESGRIELGQCNRMTFHDDFAYVACGVLGVSIVDVSFPSQMRVVGACSTFSAVATALFGDYIYVADLDAGISIIDASNPVHPVIAGHYAARGYVTDVAVKDEMLYIAEYTDGIEVLDLANPVQPEQVGYFDTPGIARSIQFMGRNIVVADWTNLAIYRYTGPVAVGESSVEAPSTFELLSAYPNPFNSSTTISFSTGAINRAPTTLRVYDTQGRLVSELLNSRLEAGEHKVVWNANGLPGGVYLLRLESNQELKTMKVVLLK